MGSVTIFGNQRVQNPIMHKSCKLREFSRHFVPHLNLFVDFHYRREGERFKDMIVSSLDHFGRYLEVQGLHLAQRKIRILLLPLRVLNERPSGRPGNEIALNGIRRKGVAGEIEEWEMPIAGGFKFPDTVSIAIGMTGSHGVIRCVLHEVIHALSAKTNEADNLITRIGVYAHNRMFDMKMLEALNEGLTEYFAKMFGEGCTPDGNYEPLIKGVSLLAQVIGVKPLLEALFGNDLAPIESALAAKGFPETAMNVMIIDADADWANSIRQPSEFLFEYIASFISPNDIQPQQLGH